MVVVYANIIDVIGKRLYSGNIVWVREYVQNAFDANANNVTIKIENRDITIEDDGDGMELEEINNQLFSLGGSVKTQEKIGQFGIGAYAGTGICNSIKIRTRKGNGPTYIITLNMEKYNEIIKKERYALFDDVISEIYSISKENEKPEVKSSFTIVKFIDVQVDTIKQITEKEGANLREVLEDYVPLELDDQFPHKVEIEEFLEMNIPGNGNRKLRVTLSLDGNAIPIRKYVNKNFEFLPVLICKNIVGNEGNIIAKLWALYSKNGNSLAKNASFILRYKGVAVGGHDVLSQFSVKDTKRYIGEIVVTGLDLELNTQRSWFMDSPLYSEFKNKMVPILKKLYDLAEFDSKIGNGLLRKYEQLESKKKALESEKSKGNEFNVSILNTKIMNLEGEIEKKRTELKDRVSKLENGSDKNEFVFYDKALKAIATRVLNELPQRELDVKIETVPKTDKKWNSSAFVRSLLEKYVVDSELVKVASHKNSKDTLNNVFTLIESKLKEKLEVGNNRRKDAEFWKMVKLFVETYDAPTFVDEKDRSSYSEAFTNFMTGAYGIFRNPSSHTFIDHYKDERYNTQFLILGDILVSLIESWMKKK